MTTRFIGLCVPFALALAFTLPISCGSSDDASKPDAGASGRATGGAAGSASAGRGGSVAEAGQNSAGSEVDGGSGGDGGSAGSAIPNDAGGAAGDIGNAGAGGESGGPDVVKPPLNPADVPDLAFWLNGASTAYSDIDENVIASPNLGLVRSAPQPAPLVGSWQAGTSLDRPFLEGGAIGFKPVESSPGTYLTLSGFGADGTIRTDNSTMVITFRPLNGYGGPGQGLVSGPIGMTPQALGACLIGNSVGVYFNHSITMLNKALPRGALVSMMLRFTPTGVNVLYDINGLRSTESIAATIASETATRFSVGYDGNVNASLYGYVSQVVGINRAITDDESDRLLQWVTAQPIPDAFPVTKPLLAVLGDSIETGAESWPYQILYDVAAQAPDLQLLNASIGGTGIPKVKGSVYSDEVAPHYSADRAKNILILSTGTNDLANGNDLTDMLTRYYSLLDAARAAGWKVIAATILPRSNPEMLVGIEKFESLRTSFNSDLLTNWSAHADALVDIASIPNLGAFGDSDDTNYYSDKIHPTAAGQALLEQQYLAKVAGLL